MNHIAGVLLISLVIFLSALSPVSAQPVPEPFPQFIVPGQEQQMQSLRSLYWLHYAHSGPLIPLWDEWMPKATLWPAMGSAGEADAMREKWASALAGRVINDEGYVHTQQHDGPSHAEGWPFPGWNVAGGVGFHFRGTGIPGYDVPTEDGHEWSITGGKSGNVNEKGLVIDLTAPRATALQPGFAIAAQSSPWLRLNWWAKGLEHANPYVEWTTLENPSFDPTRRAYFSPAVSMDGKETRTMVPLYRIPSWKGTITQFRIGFDNPAAAMVVIKSIHTAPDTRHNVNNLNFIRGCRDYFLWTRDLAFLRSQIERMRTAMRFVEREFQTRAKKCIYTTWLGHEGRTGVRVIDGKKQLVVGQGIGSNYWDLLPFGGEDALATIYYYDTLIKLADLEAQIASHPQWNVPVGANAYDPAELRRHANEVRAYGQKRFWNDKTGRFGTMDLDGQLHDYGFTFLNIEAIYFDFASPEQAKSIRDWIDGRRIVEGDTSTGPDIYHWRFGPRSSTLRNIDYYYWGWSNPESIPFGAQVQDGGAVLGWSFHDLMSIIKVDGPDAAAARLGEILKWFDETQSAGGYRAYYAKDKSRGTLQGGNVAGGLGLDHEFFESILVPQVMLYGFLGFQPTDDGFSIDPHLPKSWPSLTITRIHLHEHVLDIRVDQDGTITISGSGPARETLGARTAAGVKVVVGEGLSVKIQN
jgi:hypothetical protein